MFWPPYYWIREVTLHIRGGIIIIINIIIIIIIIIISIYFNIKLDTERRHTLYLL